MHINHTFITKGHIEDIKRKDIRHFNKEEKQLVKRAVDLINRIYTVKKEDLYFFFRNVISCITYLEASIDNEHTGLIHEGLINTLKEKCDILELSINYYEENGIPPIEVKRFEKESYDINHNSNSNSKKHNKKLGIVIQFNNNKNED